MQLSCISYIRFDQRVVNHIPYVAHYFCRGFFEEDCFDLRDFHVDDVQQSYKDFMDKSSRPSHGGRVPRNYVRVRVLQKNVDARVDKLLSWLVR
jgi:hypothetical protein